MTLRGLFAIAALTAAAPAFAAQSQGDTLKDLPPEVRASFDFASPHPSLLSPEQQQQLDRAIEAQHQQQLAEWSELLGGESAGIQPTPGAGFADIHGRR